MTDLFGDNKNDKKREADSDNGLFVDDNFGDEFEDDYEDDFEDDKHKSSTKKKGGAADDDEDNDDIFENSRTKDNNSKAK